MALHTKHGALAANTVATVTLDGEAGDDTVTVRNRSGASEISFRVDGSAATVGGDDCHLVPAVAGAEVTVPTRRSIPHSVSLIAPAAVTYSVTSR